MSPSVVLVVVSDPFDLRALEEACAAAGTRTLAAADGAQALAMLARERIDAVLLDAHLPDVDGVEVLRILKADAKLGATPVVLLASADDERAQRLALDADDWLTRPFRVVEVQQRVRKALRAKRDDARSSEPELVDPVTRAGTAAQLVVTLDYELIRAARFGHPLSCVVARVVGLDGLRAAEGPARADAALARVAIAVRRSLRTVDHVFRSGPAELALVLPETDAEGCAAVRERLDAADRAGELWGGPRPTALRLAVGAASHPHPTADTGIALLRAAREPLGAPR